MRRFIKKLFYSINIFTIIYMIFMVSFTVYSIRTTYKSVIEANSDIEKKYNESIGNYKKVIIFILKNELPQNVNYFNSQSKLAYDLFPVKNFITIDPKENIEDNKPKGDIYSIIECHGGECIKVLVDKKELLHQISKSKSWGYGEIKEIPIRKAELLGTSTKLFLRDYKYFFVVSLVYFFILYLSQSLFLFIRNLKLLRSYNSLATLSAEKELKLTKEIEANDKLYNNVLFTQEITDEYFTHYMPRLIDRDIFIEEIDFTDVFEKIEKFFNYHVTKRFLNIVLNFDDNAKTVKSDREILFIVLLNLMFRAIYRSKISSDIEIKTFCKEDSVMIDIKDIGYEYTPKPNGKIQLYELSDPILEKLCRKIKVTTINEVKDKDINTISIHMMRFEDEEYK